MSFIITPRQLIQRAALYHQLAQLTGAGLGLVKAVEMLAKSPPSASFRPHLRQIHIDLTQGCTFTEAIRRQGRWLPEFDIALISAGEQSGRLDAVMQLLAGYCESRAQLLRQMISELAYPLFVMHFAVFILPFPALFQSGFQMGGFLAYGAKVLCVLVPVYGVTFGTVYASQGRHGEGWRSWLESILNPVPVLGYGRKCIALSRLATALEALLNAGVNIIEAWDLAAAASGSPAMARAVAEWKPRVLAGATPAEEVSASGYFPEMFANLYNTGEVSGQLDDSLKRLADFYQDEGRQRMKLLAQWIPRVVYLIIAFTIAYFIITIYMGMFNKDTQGLL